LLWGLDIENYRYPGGIDASPALAYPGAVDGFFAGIRAGGNQEGIRCGRRASAVVARPAEPPRPLKPELPPQL
jgi:hypothetical protein